MRIARAYCYLIPAINQYKDYKELVQDDIEMMETCIGKMRPCRKK